MLISSLRRDIYVFLSSIGFLIIVGLIFIYSSSSVFALERFGSAHYFVKKQIIALFLGIVGASVACFMPRRLIYSLTPLFFFGSLLLTALTLVPSLSDTIHGSSRWLRLGRFSFQPSELLKIAFVMYIAYTLSKKRNKLDAVLTGFLPLLAIVGMTAVVLLKQPDFGQAMSVSITAYLMFFIGGVRFRYLLISVGSSIPLVLLLILKKQYRIRRILTFLNPWQDPQGAGFQIIQSLIAIGSGGLSGVGIGQSKQKFFYLPMQHTDFIFSIIAEETGFFGSFLLVSLYCLFLYTGLKLAWQLHNLFATYTTIGLVFLTTLQALINLLVTTGLLPTKGIGLPLVSYGNSALIGNLLMVGLILNFARENREQFHS